MQKIVVDAALCEQLLAIGDVAEFQDESGRVIGRFVAAPLPVDYIGDEELPSDEELDRRMRESPRFTTEQVVERLRSLRGSR
jgi:hypothetical protein